MVTTNSSTEEETVTDNHPPENTMVLNVEDDEQTRLVIGAMLELYGLTPINAANGTEALTLYEKWRNRIVMAIVDVILPGLSGWELALKLKLPNPRLPVLFSSGYSVDAVRINEFDSFIAKPFTRQELYAKINRMHLFLPSHYELDNPEPMKCI